MELVNEKHSIARVAMAERKKKPAFELELIEHPSSERKSNLAAAAIDLEISDELREQDLSLTCFRFRFSLFALHFSLFALRSGSLLLRLTLLHFI